MRIKFNLWSADDIIQTYLDFIKKKNSKEVFIRYINHKSGIDHKPGFKETMEGRLEIKDKRLKELPKKVQYDETRHNLELFQKDWKIEFHLFLFKDSEDEYRNKAELSFDDSLNKEVYNHFKEFEPKKIR